jgi:oxalate decarboxylase/phosphoglucose isomerase-like protein (cupin superfamily)
MTKGHFHTTDGDEVYVVMERQGLLLLQTKEGEAGMIEMIPGHMCYVPARWADRTVNAGNHDLIFLSIWPPHIEHDYETVAQSGFPLLAVEGTDGPTAIEFAS